MDEKERLLKEYGYEEGMSKKEILCEAERVFKENINKMNGQQYRGARHWLGLMRQGVNSQQHPSYFYAGLSTIKGILGVGEDG